MNLKVLLRARGFWRVALFLSCTVALFLLFSLINLDESGLTPTTPRGIVERAVADPIESEPNLVVPPPKIPVRVPEREVEIRIITKGDDGRDPDPAVDEKREFIKRMMKDAWGEYKKYAWGENELMPLTKRGRDGGDIYGNQDIGATIIDSLGTLYLMGFEEEFERAKDWIVKNFNFEKLCNDVSLFETNIRIVGGFLSAYALTNDTMFIVKAKEVADALLPAFHSPSGIPYPRVTPCHRSASGTQISLAELGSLHLEFIYLSELTGDPKYADKVNKIRKHLRTIAPDGIYKDAVSCYSGAFARGETTIDGGADSFYEYLVKSWIQTGSKEDRRMYDQTISAMVKHGMMVESTPSKLLYVGKLVEGRVIDGSFSHLACFAGAMFALGSDTDPGTGNKERDLEFGARLTSTCHESYIRSKTGVGPERFSFTERLEAQAGRYDSDYYILRPEVIESYFTLYRITGDSKYRDWGWEAAQAIEKYCKVGLGGGYSGITNVNDEEPSQDDVQQTFFLAETLKYLYLLFSSPSVIDLNQWVFNTEAHPLPIKGKNPMFSPKVSLPKSPPQLRRRNLNLHRRV